MGSSDYLPYKFNVTLVIYSEASTAPIISHKSRVASSSSSRSMPVPRLVSSASPHRGGVSLPPSPPPPLTPRFAENDRAAADEMAAAEAAPADIGVEDESR